MTKRRKLIEVWWDSEDGICHSINFEAVRKSAVPQVMDSVLREVSRQIEDNCSEPTASSGVPE